MVSTEFMRQPDIATTTPGVLTSPRADTLTKTQATEVPKGGSGVFPATPDEAREREDQATKDRINRLLDDVEEERRNGGDGHLMLEIIKNLQQQGASGANAQREKYVPPKPGQYVGTETEESAKGKPDPQSRFISVGSSQPSGGQADLTEQADVEIPDVEVLGKKHTRIKGTILGIQPVLGWAIADAFGWLGKKIGIPRLISATRSTTNYIGTAYREGVRLREEEEARKRAAKAAKKHKQTVQEATQSAAQASPAQEVTPSAEVAVAESVQSADTAQQANFLAEIQPVLAKLKVKFQNDPNKPVMIGRHVNLTPEDITLVRRTIDSARNKLYADIPALQQIDQLVSQLQERDPKGFGLAVGMGRGVESDNTVTQPTVVEPSVGHGGRILIPTGVYPLWLADAVLRRIVVQMLKMAEGSSDSTNQYLKTTPAATLVRILESNLKTIQDAINAHQPTAQQKT